MRKTTATARRRRPDKRPDVFDLHSYMKQRAQIIDRAIAQSVEDGAGPAARLHEAMRYSLLAGGKRLRPLLVLASCEAVGGRLEAAMGLACAIEMIHTYSLIHDDLPCMDDDDLRRGRPTNHKVYGEAIATLAGDALLTDAFRVLALSAGRSAAPALVLDTIAELAAAAGSSGMVAGQAIDLLGEGKSKTVEELEQLHAMKTGALFLAAVRGGARLGGAGSAQIESLDAYARALGLAFQVVDDLLDVQGTPEQMGKRTQKDFQRGKATYPAILGVERSFELARELETRAHRAIAGFGGSADPLRQIATFVVERKL
jgi:geranylgeranyl diphosphate synthase, type II